jgi:hypothetical protein
LDFFGLRGVFFIRYVWQLKWLVYIINFIYLPSNLFQFLKFGIDFSHFPHQFVLNVSVFFINELNSELKPQLLPQMPIFERIKRHKLIGIILSDKIPDIRMLGADECALCGMAFRAARTVLEFGFVKTHGVIKLLFSGDG